jgi:ectoine hydroxylase-related dioxygenase (phytanoyl-CoA dioxygenase family)
MHRQRTKLSKRVNRVASAVERRGIVATYELHERLLGNRSARRRYSSHEPNLDETQAQVVDALDRDGYVTLPLTDLVDEEQWKAIEAQGAAFIADTERTLTEGGSGKVRPGKEFVVRAHSFEGVILDSDDPWFAFSSSRRMLDVANAYLRLWSKLSYVDLWYTAQQPATDERVASQNWHVDFDDKHLLKAFVYLSDVDAGHGPFQYVPGSQPGGRHHSVRPWVPMGYGRVPDEDVARNVPAEEIATFTGPKGTLILCNTSGLHRGGFATSGPRVLATATYCSPASLKALSNRNYSTPLASSATDPVVRYALS